MITSNCILRKGVSDYPKRKYKYVELNRRLHRMGIKTRNPLAQALRYRVVRKKIYGATLNTTLLERKTQLQYRCRRIINDISAS